MLRVCISHVDDIRGKARFANVFGSTLVMTTIKKAPNENEYFTWRGVYLYAGCEVTPIRQKISTQTEEKMQFFP